LFSIIITPPSDNHFSEAHALFAGYPALSP
jgi:hypothetical protein